MTAPTEPPAPPASTPDGPSTPSGSGGSSRQWSSRPPAGTGSPASGANDSSSTGSPGVGAVEQKVQDEVAKRAAQAAHAATLNATKVLGKTGDKAVGKGVEVVFKHRFKLMLLPFVPYIAIFLGFAMVVSTVVAVFGSSEDIEVRDGVIGEDFAKAQLKAYRHAVRGTDVPWTIIAALASLQTDHGRLSPYDNVDRTGKSSESGHIHDGRSFSGGAGQHAYSRTLVDASGGRVSLAPEVTPPIGSFTPPDDHAIQSQGLGPFLLSPVAVMTLGESGAQNVAAAGALIAEQLQKNAEALLAQGDFELDDNDPDAADALWSAAIDMLGPMLADPTGEVADCAVAPSSLTEETVADVIDAVWRCEIAQQAAKRRPLQTVDSVVRLPDGAVEYRVMDRADAATVLTMEALQVANAFSGLQLRGASVADVSVPGPPVPGCPATAALAGIFPLPVSDAYDRCDPMQNIVAAAKRVIATEVVAPQLRSATAKELYRPMAGGWDSLEWVFGLGSGRTAFNLAGPYGSWVPSLACADQLQIASDLLADGGQIDRWFAPVAEAVAVPGAAPVVLADPMPIYSRSGLAALRSDARCDASALGQATWDYYAVRYLTNYAAVQRAMNVADGEEGEREALRDDVATARTMPPLTVAALSRFATDVSAKLPAATPFAPGVTPALARLRPTNSTPAVVPVTTGSLRQVSGGLSIGYRVVQLAVSYGGMVRGDKRESTLRPVVGAGVEALVAAGVPAHAAEAYVVGEQVAATEFPDCQLDVTLLAAVGAKETSHFTHGGATVGPDGVVSPPIIGDPLDGRPGVMKLEDTEQGLLDGDTIWDRAVGPFQFIPTSWERFGGGGNPQSIFDSAAAAARHLCTPPRSSSPPVVLSTRTAEGDALASYGGSNARPYAALVLAIADQIRAVVVTTGSFSGSLIANPGTTIPTVRVADHAGGTFVVSAEIGAQIQAMVDAAAGDGVILRGGGFRTHEEQVVLRIQNCGSVDPAASSRCSPPTAVPGTSRHESGRAIDFRDIPKGSPGYRWLTANAARYGLKNFPAEYWHWSTDGK